MLKHFLILIGILAAFIPAISQSDFSDASYVEIKWKVGDEKTIYQTDSNIIYDKDSLFMSTGILTNYKIKIVSEVDTTYEVLFKQINLDQDIDLSSETMDVSEVETMLQELINSIQVKMLGLEYSFLVSKNMGIAYKVKNQKELEELIEELVIVFLNQFITSDKVELSNSEKDEIQLIVKEYIAEQMPAAIQTMLNSFNYIFQAYSFPYNLEETYTADVEVYSIDQIQHGEITNDASVAVNSEITGSNLTIDYEYFYDLEAAYQDYVVAAGIEEQVPFKLFDLKEKVITDFDIKSSWISESTSLIDVIMGDLIIINKSSIVFK